MMDALEFAREHDRMCNMYRESPTGSRCLKCPISGKCMCDDWTQTVPIVEKWSKEHPIVRNVDHVAEGLEKLGYKVDREYLANFTCPTNKSIKFAKRDRECVTVTCEDCRKWWLEEYKGEDINVLGKGVENE